MAHYLLDCDPGHDDAVAILMAARHLNLVGLSTVFGNSTVENTTKNALAILDAAGRGDIPVARGVGSPLAGVRHSGETVHGKSGLDGASLKPSARQPIALDAVDFIIDQARKFDDLIIIAVAPQTNLALALRKAPDIIPRIREISVMGGSTSFGNATAAAEFNIYADPEAAAEVFDAGIPIRMTGLNVTTTFGVDNTVLDELRKTPGLGREIAGALQYYLHRQQSIYDRRFAPMHDVCAVLPYIHADWLEYEPMHVVVECEGRHTRGMTLCDLRGPVEGDGIESSMPHNAEVAVAVNGAAITRLVVETLQGY